jgi:hypothetical protein
MWPWAYAPTLMPGRAKALSGRHIHLSPGQETPPDHGRLRLSLPARGHYVPYARQAAQPEHRPLSRSWEASSPPALGRQDGSSPPA